VQNGNVGYKKYGDIYRCRKGYATCKGYMEQESRPMSDEYELKPCPFCGGETAFLQHDEDVGWMVTCEFCDATIYTWSGDPNVAIDKWNQRDGKER
jgi:Lar family restriction alleviation protein